MTVTLTSYAEAREALRTRTLRQALYEEGAVVMEGVIVNLHGQAHIDRRRLENRLFRRDVFAWYERERIPAIIAREIEQPLAVGRVDLVSLARRTMMQLSVDVAGVDLPVGDDETFARFAGLMDDMARAATVVHATGDKAAIRRRGSDALRAFDYEFYRPALARRAELVDAADHEETALPRDVLTTLLVNHDQLRLTPEIVLREVAYYPWVGAHSTSNQFVHAMHHLLTWTVEHPDAREQLVVDGTLRRRFVHESMRLHPASPVAVRSATESVTLECSGRSLAAGETIIISIEDANRDPAAVGVAAERFDPFRRLADDVPGWGLSFGTGTHACLGRELAGGQADDAPGSPLLGAVAVMAGTLLEHGARPDPADPPQQDPATTRDMWGCYPVLIG
jgi:cytochrome P450